jgi:hypothetical protein
VAFLVISLTTIVAIDSAIHGGGKIGLQIVALPNVDEIAVMVAWVDDLRNERGIYPVREFSVPPDYIPSLLGVIEPAQSDATSPLGYDRSWGTVYPKIGGITIKTTAGKAICIELYDTGKTVAAFTIDGIRCFRSGAHNPVFIGPEYESYVDESVLLIDVIREIAWEVETNAQSARLASDIEEFQRSRGERQPRRQ